MENKMMRSALLAFALTVLAVSGAGAQEAAAGDESAANPPQKERNWVLRFGFLVADTLGDNSVTMNPGQAEVSLSGGAGAFVSLERRISPLVGVEFNLIGMGTDLNVSTGAGHKHSVYSDVELMSMGSIALGVNFHFVDEGPIDVYAGPMLAFNRYADLAVRTGIHGDWTEKHDEWSAVRSRSDSEVTWGAKAGIDIFLGKKKKWSVGGSLTYMDATYDFRGDSGSGSSEMSFDPLMFSFGAGFRF